MLFNFKGSLSKYVLLLIISVQLSLLILVPPRNTLSYDIFGYYLYLPQTFIYHDLAIKNEKRVLNILDKYKNAETFYHAFKANLTGNYVIKYPVGMAVTYSPFFFMGHLYAKIFNYEADGFSTPYQNFILYGCFFYTILGLIFLRKVLKHFYDEKTTSIVLLTVFLCTNYFCHVPLFAQGAMSHNLLFTLYAMIIWFTIRWHQTLKLKHICALGFCIGLAALIRATELLTLIIPFFYNVTSIPALRDKLKLLRANLRQIMIFAAIILVLGSIQLIYFKIYAGKFLYNSYGGNPGEGFEFLHPYILETLFSFRKGWFVYTPVILFFIAGIFTRTFRLTGFKLATLLFLIMVIYITACWSCWWYAGSFGQRALIPTIALLSLPFGELTKQILEKRIRFVFLVILFLLGFLNLFQTWQIAMGIMDIERMTRPYYASIFLQNKAATKKQKELLLVERSYSVKDSLDSDDLSKLQKGKNVTLDFENTNTNLRTDSVFKSGRHSLVVPGKTYSPEISDSYSELTDKYFMWIKVSAWYYIPKRDSAYKILLKATMTHNNYEYKMRELENDDSAERGWHKLEFFYLTPEIRNPKKDKFKIYIDNRSDAPVLIDDLHFETYEPKTNQSVF